MTLNDLIKEATTLTHNLSGGDIPILVNGKEVNITLMFADSNIPMVNMRINEVHTLPTNYIDLGLSVKWADCNVGAVKPEEYGDYLTYDDAMNLPDIMLPSKEKWEELMDKCNWEWEDNGYKVTGPNGNSIFLPAAGYRYNIDFNNTGTYGCYWSSSLDTDYPGTAWYVCFYSGDASRYSDNCYYGLSVRAVKR